MRVWNILCSHEVHLSTMMACTATVNRKTTSMLSCKKENAIYMMLGQSLLHSANKYWAELEAFNNSPLIPYWLSLQMALHYNIRWYLPRNDCNVTRVLNSNITQHCESFRFGNDDSVTVTSASSGCKNWEKSIVDCLQVSMCTSAWRSQEFSQCNRSSSMLLQFPAIPQLRTWFAVDLMLPEVSCISWHHNKGSWV